MPEPKEMRTYRIEKRKGRRTEMHEITHIYQC
jgi:hypothetical protein